MYQSAGHPRPTTEDQQCHSFTAMAWTIHFWQTGTATTDWTFTSCKPPAPSNRQPRRHAPHAQSRWRRHCRS